MIRTVIAIAQYPDNRVLLTRTQTNQGRLPYRLPEGVVQPGEQPNIAAERMLQERFGALIEFPTTVHATIEDGPDHITYIVPCVLITDPKDLKSEPRTTIDFLTLEQMRREVIEGSARRYVEDFTRPLRSFRRECA